MRRSDSLLRNGVFNQSGFHPTLFRRKPGRLETPISEAQKKFVYHAEMQIGNQRVMFSDITDFDIIQGNNFFVVLTFDRKEDVERVYNLLLPESKVLIPIQRTTYSSCEANLIDKYGIRWGLTTEQTES